VPGDCPNQLGRLNDIILQQPSLRPAVQH
jgi:hypothetical protein